MQLSLNGLKEKDFWESSNIKLPLFDIEELRKNTFDNPTWLHFGGGNICRGFINRDVQSLINQGLMDTGIVIADTFDKEIIEQIYKPYDELTLMVDLNSNGNIGMEVIGSVTESLIAMKECREDMKRLTKIFTSPSLQIVSFTITEKGYTLYNMNGDLLPIVEADIKNGPSNVSHAMSIVTSLVYERYKATSTPLALVSMDNCSHNGEKLRTSIMTIAKKWLDSDFVDYGFIDYLNTKVSFPWSMIDKITPRPDTSVADKLISLGLENIAPITTSKGTYIAPFVNAEVPQYLVIEDDFPNGRPDLTKCGILLTDRDTVNKCEKMKVTTCLNPLHTCLAVFGCLLGYTLICEEMKDNDLVNIITKMGYKEGLPVVTDPGILNPKAFIDEVIFERLPNPFMPDAPQRIATDTSLKMPIRFGETIKSYINSDTLKVTDLTYIPLTIAGWFRYLLGIDDNGEEMPISSDPMLEDLKKGLSVIRYGNMTVRHGCLNSLLSNESIFGADLTQCGLSDKIELMLSSMLEGKGAVRDTIHRYAEL
ncbi:MAG: mannitol dehydrogenase family protein [Clostridia bacterium]|nr:mannitol dehydrogenase family protein [Clostridia bacterium]